MKIGQISFKKLSDKSDYLQLDICGLGTEEALSKYNAYGKKIPVILHGDWTKKGCSENNLEERKEDYISIIKELKKVTKVLGFTLHPPKKSKMDMDRVTEIVKDIEKQTNTNIFVENRSSKAINLSNAEEVISYSKGHKMTIDIPQLYISCGYNQKELLRTLSKINMTNVKEIHLANIKRDGSHTYVGRKLNDGELDIKTILKKLPKRAYYTLEILGQTNTFETNRELLQSL